MFQCLRNLPIDQNNILALANNLLETQEKTRRDNEKLQELISNSINRNDQISQQANLQFVETMKLLVNGSNVNNNTSSNAATNVANHKTSSITNIKQNGTTEINGNKNLIKPIKPLDLSNTHATNNNATTNVCDPQLLLLSNLLSSGAPDSKKRSIPNDNVVNGSAVNGPKKVKNCFKKFK